MILQLFDNLLEDVAPLSFINDIDNKLYALYPLCVHTLQFQS